MVGNFINAVIRNVADVNTLGGSGIGINVIDTNTIFNNELFIALHYFLVPKRLGRQYLLIRGVAAFMINIANDIPSG